MNDWAALFSDLHRPQGMINPCEKCEQKGLCCYNTVLHNNCLYILKSMPCKFLDLETKECTVYENRLKMNPNCKTIDEIAEIGGNVPPKCNYKGIYKFKKKLIVANPKMEKKLKKKYFGIE